MPTVTRVNPAVYSEKILSVQCSNCPTYCAPSFSHN